MLGLRRGDELRVGLVDGPTGTATVTAASAGEIEIECAFDGPPSPRPSVDLVLCVPRPKSLRKLLPQVAALGVDRLVLLRSWRVEPSYLAARAIESDAIRALLLDGLTQSSSTALPRFTVEPRFRPFVEDRLPQLAQGATRLVLHPGASTGLAGLAVGDQRRVVLVIGPEGGLVDFELERLGRAGFEPRRLGSGVLRVETACVAGLAQIELLREIARSKSARGSTDEENMTDATARVRPG